MALSNIMCEVETSSEPLTKETMQEIQLTIAGMSLKLKQDGDGLDLVRDEVQDDRYLVRMNFSTTTKPTVKTNDEAVQTSPVPSTNYGDATDLSDSVRLPSPQTLPLRELSVELRTVTLLVYPSLVGVLYEIQAAFTTAHQVEPTPPTQPSKRLKGSPYTSNSQSNVGRRRRRQLRRLRRPGARR